MNIKVTEAVQKRVRQIITRAKEPNKKKLLLPVGRNITTSHCADMNLDVRQQPKDKGRDMRREGGRASMRERAEVVGEAEADNMLGLRSTD